METNKLEQEKKVKELLKHKRHRTDLSILYAYNERNALTEGETIRLKQLLKKSEKK